MFLGPIVEGAGRATRQIGEGGALVERPLHEFVEVEGVLAKGEEGALDAVVGPALFAPGLTAGFRGEVDGGDRAAGGPAMLSRRSRVESGGPTASRTVPTWSAVRSAVEATAARSSSCTKG
ncbi:hypothetical protein ACH4XT_11450 [Streptomyces avidinii]|uniref:hypothetical protein n=1 Tax=Streptomyces avidinii TaxID=1895 RepID=UPI0037894DCE